MLVTCNCRSDIFYDLNFQKLIGISANPRDTIDLRFENFMNIGITVYPSYGGSGIVGSELGRELAARGHNVHFISSIFSVVK